MPKSPRPAANIPEAQRTQQLEYHISYGEARQVEAKLVEKSGKNRWMRHTEQDATFTKDAIKNLPISRVESPDRLRVILLVDPIFTAKKANPQAVTRTWEAEIVCLAYGLTPAGRQWERRPPGGGKHG